ncbi:hypothetical protein O181_005498 [Austropuccinia psidii MF-1]|uniref:Integrase catalytic domain-containing protein n=1 Tax=Austropuccinia psidii MF-1 TaxID=1389203 RepID=A0A9Q3BID0_9BASI|nr:hypothetical protein [Austropuccinia psidii MF-1]
MFHLRSKDLLDVCEKLLATGSTPTTINKYTKASHEAINIIASRISHVVFLEVINQETKHNAHLLWTKINNEYVLKRAINRGRVWMDWIWFNYHGDLQDYINSFRKLKRELDAVKIKIEAKLLSFSILGKLVRDPKLQHYVKDLTFNDNLIENPDLILTKLQDLVNNLRIQPEKIDTPSSALTTSAHPYKITHYCAKSKHNPNCTSHSKEQCFTKNPNLRLERRNNCRRFPSNIPPSAHISSAQASALITGSPDLISSIKLIIDCGATHHTFNSKTLFSTLNKIPPLRISTGDSSSSLVAEGMGTVNLTCKEATLSLKNCLYVPRLNCNLVSLLELFQDKIIITRKDDSFSLSFNNTPLLKGKILNNLLIVNYSNPKSLLTTTRDSLWNNWLGHPGDGPLKSMGLPINSVSCQTCLTSKSHQLPFNNHFDPVHNPLDCVHIDLVGPISPMSISGFHYFLTLVDQAMSFKMVKFLKNKLDALEQFLISKLAMENLHDQKLKKLVSNRGGKFLNQHFAKISEVEGFTHVLSPAETHQHNGFAKRCNRTILDKARCLLGGSGLPNSYWEEAINTSTFLCNIIPTPS